jgi:hypothetical protein
MTTDQACRLGQRARRASDQGDEDAARVLVRDVVRAATDLQRRGKRQEATALTAAFERGCHGETAYEALQRSQAAAAVWAADDYRLEG